MPSLNEAADAVRDAPLTQRAPERLQALVNGIAPDGKVYLPAEGVRSYMQADGGDLGPFIRAGVADQIPAALATGSDVVVPVDAYMAHLAPTPIHEALKDDLRTSPDGMSVNEANDFQQHYDELLQSRGDDLASEAKASAEAAAPMQRVFSDVQSQARQAGYSVDVARQYAAL